MGVGRFAGFDLRSQDKPVKNLRKRVLFFYALFMLKSFCKI